MIPKNLKAGATDVGAKYDSNGGIASTLSNYPLQQQKAYDRETLNYSRIYKSLRLMGRRYEELGVQNHGFS